MSEPRALTVDEVRTAFLEHVRSMVDYWETVESADGQTLRSRLEGLAFSILVALDGSALALPAFKVSPMPHPDDAAFNRAQGENWYPTDVDIAGSLHELIWRQEG